MATTAQHYVPQFLLRNFAFEKRGALFLHCFDKSVRRQFTTNPKNMAQEIGYYDFTGQDGQTVSFEPILATMESRLKVALNAICQLPTLDSLKNTQDALGFFIALQMLRTPGMRQLFIELTDSLNAQVKSIATIPALFGDGLTAAHAALILKSLKPFREIFQRMGWFLLVNNTPQPFWLSDEPITLYNPGYSPQGPQFGLLSKGIQIYFPLSPKLVVSLRDPVLYGPAHRVMEVLPADVTFTNYGQVVYSRRFLFSPKPDFRLAREILVKNSELGNPKRPRFVSAKSSRSERSKC